jgi:4-amino-4-deoxy-L-arabinose transferase-like glycosyltransferase
VVLIYGVIGLGLLPWALWLSAALKPHHVTERWDLAWSGFDTGLALMFLSTALAAHLRSPWVGALAAATGTLLVTDAWFDVVLESHADELRQSILLAAVAEIPTAALCFWIAYRTERFLAKVVDEVLHEHVAPPGEGTTEGDLVGVLEVTPDGEPAGESRDADATA